MAINGFENIRELISCCNSPDDEIYIYYDVRKNEIFGYLNTRNDSLLDDNGIGFVGSYSYLDNMNDNDINEFFSGMFSPYYRYEVFDMMLDKFDNVYRNDEAWDLVGECDLYESWNNYCYAKAAGWSNEFDDDGNPYAWVIVENPSDFGYYLVRISEKDIGRDFWDLCDGAFSASSEDDIDVVGWAKNALGIA